MTMANFLLKIVRVRIVIMIITVKTVKMVKTVKTDFVHKSNIQVSTMYQLYPLAQS